MKNYNVIVLNLKHREDRRNRILNLFNNYFDQYFKIFILEAYLNKKNGHKGCAFSHSLAIEYAIHKKMDNLIIVEDDVYFPYPLDKLKATLLELEKIEWDLIALGSNFDIEKDISENLTKPSRMWQATMQIINKNYFQKYYEFLFKSFKNQEEYFKPGENLSWNDPWVFDQVWNKELLGKDKIYCTKNRFAYQIANMSNTTNVMMDGVKEFIQ
jgi:hypothetical protein